MRRRTLPALAAVVLLTALSATAAPAAVAAASCGAGSSTLLDGGFETPVIAAGGNSSLDASLVPPWLTTDSANQIEIWGSGFNGVPAAQGAQFVEINANSAGTLYQDVVTMSGEKMTWSLEHRGRSGTDTMKVLIGDAATADVGSDTGWNFFSPDLSDPNTAWGAHTGSYVVPSGQTCTRFGFRAVSSAGGDNSFGNFLDAVSFSVTVPRTPSPRPSPPVTSTIGPDRSADSGPGWLMLIGLAIAGIVTGAWSVRRQAAAGSPGRGARRH
ncbi:MAG TPA: hypothetical protein VKR24_02730 [Candidatus Limnocylindrales bacterium]|nr:hypothetical protein [Candidatus Limnocylindrales bacterium]